jgi:hypothetical protein
LCVNMRFRSSPFWVLLPACSLRHSASDGTHLSPGTKNREEVKKMKDEIKLQVEELEERIAPSNPPGQLGYEGQPGNQGNGLGGYEGQPGNQGGN